MKKITLVAKFALCCCLLAAMSGTVFAQAVLTDLGINSDGTYKQPTHDANDIYNVGGADVQFADGLTYYDNYNNGLTPGGQTFYVPHPMVVTAVSLQLGGDYGACTYGPSLGPRPFWLRIFSIANDGTTATLVTAYESQPWATFWPLHWIQWTNITVPLISANGNFAYTFGCDPPDATGWMQLWASGGNMYTNGQICMIDNAGGTNAVHYGITGRYDANFCIWLDELTAAVTTPIVISPTNIIFLGSSVTLAETAGGIPPLAYQWQTDGGGGGALTNIPGATTNTYTFTPPAPGTYHFQIVVTNLYTNTIIPGVWFAGAATSAVAVLTVHSASPPLLTTDIGINNTNVYGFVGGNVSFYANFGLGTMPITNQWLVKLDSGGDYTPIAGAASSAWTLTNVQSGSPGWYELAATNAIGRSNSAAAHLTALADPPAPVPGDVTNDMYAYYVINTLKPWAYWRFEETNDTFLSSMQAYDYSGHNFDATYGNSNGVAGTGCLDGGESMAYGHYGPTPYDFPNAYAGFETNNGCAGLAYNKANGYLTVPPLNLNINTVTFTMWIYPNSDIVHPYSGLLMWHNGVDVAGVGFGGDSQVTTTPPRNMAELGYTWNTNSSATYDWHSHLYPLGGIWSFAAWVITPTNTTIYMYYVANGQTNVLKHVQVINNTPESFMGGTTCLGSDNFNNVRTFDGSIDEVAIFTNSMSEAQIQDLFLRSLGLQTPIPATITVPPQPVTVWQGQPLRMSVNGGGIPSPTWQWQGGTNIVPGNFNSGVLLVGNILNTSLYGGVSGALTPDLLYSNYSRSYNWMRVLAGNTINKVTSSWARVNQIFIPGNTNAQWTMNFNVMSDQNGGPNAAYNGRGVLGTGTKWNGLSGGQLQNSTHFLDDWPTIGPGILFGATNDVGMPVWHNAGWDGFNDYDGNWYAGGGGGLLLLDQFVAFSTNNGGIEFDFTGVPTGKYNLALYGIDGVYANDATAFTVQGVTQSCTNSWEVSRDINFGPDNTVIYTNLLVTNGTLAVAMTPVYVPRICPVSGCGPLQGAFNGAQLQLVRYGPGFLGPFTNNTLSWIGGGLYEATNVLGPWVTNPAVSPYTVTPTGFMKFYRIYNPDF